MTEAVSYTDLARRCRESLARVGRLTRRGLDVSSLAIYLQTGRGSYIRAYATDGYPPQHGPDPGDVEQQLIEALHSDAVQVVDARARPNALADHPWLARSGSRKCSGPDDREGSGDAGWRSAAAASLVFDSEQLSAGCVVVLDNSRGSFDDSWRAAFVDTAELIVDIIDCQQTTDDPTDGRDREDSVGAVAAVAAGVAHEINNPLSFVVSNIQFALHVLEAKTIHPDDDGQARLSSADLDAMRMALKDAAVGGKRIRRVVRDLQRLAAGTTGGDPLFTIEPISVVAPLRSSIKMVRDQVEQRATLTAELDQVDQVLGNESKLGQVFSNLLFNAAHAIPPGDVDANEVRAHAFNRGAATVVSITDTGSGIPDNVRGRLFEPFFTTKPHTEGTGLGLAISRNIITTLSGHIEVDTTVGKGTTFRVVLPHRSALTAQFDDPASLP